MDIRNLCGWKNDPAEVERLTPHLAQFFAPSPDQTRDAHNHLIFRKATGVDSDDGPQGIGDCVSWGYAHFINYTQVLNNVYDAQNSTEDPQTALARIKLEYQQTATEPIYALSRVEVGGQRGSYEDGSVGAWAIKAVKDYGSLSRPHLARLGLSPTYSPQRAKDWGAKGLPDNLEPEAFKHTFGTTTQVRSFAEAAWHIQNGRVVPVCSNVGFENGRGSGAMTVRDSQGFARPNGVWMHCMTFVSLRWDRPGLLLLNQWPKSSVAGPKAFEQPDVSWWVDAEVVDRMLRQNDSYTGDSFNGYPAKIIDTTWYH